MFISDEPAPKYYARDGATLDPKKLNESIRHAAKQIKYTQRHKYTYSQMNFDLIGLDLKSASPEERRFVIRPPENIEITGAHIVAAGLIDGESIFARWIDPDDATTGGAAAGKVAVIEALSTGNALPDEEDVSMPTGTSTQTFKYVSAEGQDAFSVVEGVTTRPVNLVKDKNYIIELGYSGFTVGSSKIISVEAFASLVLFVRSDRGSSDEWSVPELLDGSDVTYATAGTSDPAGLQDIITSVASESSASLSAAQSDTVRCDVIKASNLSGSTLSAGDLNMVLSSRIPRFPTFLNNGRYTGETADYYKTQCKWSLYRVDFVLVSDAATFSPTAGDSYEVTLSLESQSGIVPPSSGTNFYRVSGAKIGVNGTDEYKEVYVRGPTASSGSGLESQIDSSTLVGGNQVSPLNPDHDLKTYALANVVGGAQNVKLAYMYVWYRLTA